MRAKSRSENQILLLLSSVKEIKKYIWDGLYIWNQVPFADTFVIPPTETTEGFTVLTVQRVSKTAIRPDSRQTFLRAPFHLLKAFLAGTSHHPKVF